MNEVFILNELDDARKTVLIKEMMPVTRKSFSKFSKVVSEESLLKKLSVPHGINSINIHRDEKGVVVGYVSMTRFEMSFLKRHCTIFLYGPACFYKEFRKHSLGVSFTFAQPFKYQIEHPETECYYFGMSSNPSSYLATIGHADTGWPHYEVKMPDIVKKFIEKIQHFLYGDTHIHWKHPENDAYQASWRPNDDEKTQAFWATSTNPHVTFFRQQNRDYERGYCLPFVVPLSKANLSAYANYFMKKGFDLIKNIKSLAPDRASFEALFSRYMTDSTSRYILIDQGNDSRDSHEYVCFDFYSLKPNERLELVEKLFYKLYLKLFTGRDYNSFKSQFYNEKAEKVLVYLVKDTETHKIVGYALIRVFLVKPTLNSLVSPQEFAIFRGQSGILPEHRGKHDVDKIFRHAFHNYEMTHPDCNIILFDSALTHISYTLVIDSYNYSYPRENQLPPRTVRELIEYLRDYFGYRKIDPTSQVMIYSTSTSILPEREQLKTQKNVRPTTVFFRSNTKFEEGKSIMILCIYKLLKDNPLGLPPGIHKRYLYRPFERNLQSTALRALLKYDESNSPPTLSRL